ncbi:hypothetical protein [Pigmentibacter ruber]|uniref:hypothetical protein n=1 Tax=Pigmentibacter ruber TaxID=2683196 RepID=UPI00131B0BB1|nr:hypothetical protein [Pigmentibacter ruber]
MNKNQKKLSDLLHFFDININSISKTHPGLFPAFRSEDEIINDPETDRFRECVGYMLSQAETNFTDRFTDRKNNSLSTYIEEWFEPLTSSLILQANINKDNIYSLNLIPEKSNFYFNNKGKNPNIFNNPIPIEILPIEIYESTFELLNNKNNIHIKIKILQDLKELPKISLYFESYKISSFYKVLDEILITKDDVIFKCKSNKIPLNRKVLNYSFKTKFDLSIFKNSNLSYYLFQFANYINNYTFIDFNTSDLKISFKEGDEIELIIPINESSKELTKVKNFVHANCFAVKNTTEKQGDPFKLKKGTKGFYTLDRASKKNLINFSHLEFFNKEHKNIDLKINDDYEIIKKYITFEKKLDIIYYLKIKNELPEDLILVPYFKTSNLTESHFIQLNSNFFIKNNKRLVFSNITTPTKTTFFFEFFNDEVFYKNLFKLNNALISSNFSIINFLNILSKFSEISINYKGIIPKIMEQFHIQNEMNSLKYNFVVNKTMLLNEYSVDIFVDKQKFKFGGITLLFQFINELTNKISGIGFKINLNIHW